MIKETEKLKYDYDDQQYYITPQAIINELPVSDDELKENFGDTDNDQMKEIRTLCRRLYNYMFAHNYPENHNYIKWRIYKNNFNERYFLKEAMKSFVYGALESGMDLNEYHSTTDQPLPNECLNNLKNANLMGLPMYKGKVPEGDY